MGNPINIMWIKLVPFLGWARASSSDGVAVQAQHKAARVLTTSASVCCDGSGSSPGDPDDRLPDEEVWLAIMKHCICC